MVSHLATLRRQTTHTSVGAAQPGVSGAAVVLTLSVEGAKQALQMLLLLSTPVPDLYIGSFLAASWRS